MSTKIKVRKMLVLGSGALKIGEAGEFDYSGSQAIKALKEEGIYTILVNPNIATIQTSDMLADRVYFLPITPYFVERIIEKEKPDGIFLSFGGQTALNCGIELHRKKILQKHNITVYGTHVSSIIKTEDREKFANHLKQIHVNTPRSIATTTITQSILAAKKLGYPVMVRAAYALGGQKSGPAYIEKQLHQRVTDAFSFSSQVLIEQYLHHYKEIEYEVVRDRFGNCIAVCNMENMDPLGIHTGESIVVAPSQTLSNHEYHFLREKAIEIVQSLKIVGECNVQFALNPRPKKQDVEYAVIEVNARLSRSSALASKATGYPLAYIAAKLALGKGLFELKNTVTRTTSAFFEPALDYIVVKMPRWDLDKFKDVHQQIGSSMKSVGEVMAIGRNFEETVQKALRMLDIGEDGIVNNAYKNAKDTVIRSLLKNPTPKRIFVLHEALRRDYAIQDIYEMTGIDTWFLHAISKIVVVENKLKQAASVLSKQLLKEAKQSGFSDSCIARLTKKREQEVRQTRVARNIIPSFFQIDTLAGEVPAKTNYLYATYIGSHHDIRPLTHKAIIVLGSGPYRIGSSVEFDWACVNTAQYLHKHKKKSIIINCNPETVSTDYDVSDRLYFEELTLERILDIYSFENPYGAIVSVGGQIPNNLALPLAKNGAHILGTDPLEIRKAENRNTFSDTLDTLSIKQPSWSQLISVDKAISFADNVGYPVLIRPSFVLSGDAMMVCYTKSDLEEYMGTVGFINKKYPVTVSKFVEGAREIEYDGVAQYGEILIQAISEHVESAGVHSGDATIVYPAQKVYLKTESQIQKIAHNLAKKFSITGPFNIQFLARNNVVYVIELNLRASRTLPFISKASNVNFTRYIADSFFGKGEKHTLGYCDYVVVKAPQFSFARLEGADPTLRVEMASTGEVGCFGNTFEEALLKAELSVGGKIPSKGIFLSLGGDKNKIRFLRTAYHMSKLGLPIYATDKTARFLRKNKIYARKLYKIHERMKPNVIDFLHKKKIDIVINIVDSSYKKDVRDDYIIRRATIDSNVYLITDSKKAMAFIKACSENTLEQLSIKAWDEYGA
ncbi:carbamoyl phosphate synthase large subunit [Candidatus Roizmanbacteria bacterium CG10_big_fil_rev_8_21_14_0_10_39_6]|uniref:Carbamoyl phosphate synthase arginine-specific large chain n=1 Tax=Candidatus Roizmanbacteria bacterium CG10_big_fil_rev_8_21_14_0_10_39_6 TaxID=1974853 RepID=A0A2M8KSU4_9BACT|nr:MAG: carbamoyl phosphate synthase large subunit [Candidatus Roizmanbacteria bacterium CG10_big_fil_rev_8_21_14_0_10_39_6]